MPKLTKIRLGYYDEKDLVGVITFGWGTRPLHTIQKLFPELTTKDYYEIGKMAMDDKMPRNSESKHIRRYQVAKAEHRYKIFSLGRTVW